jgi:hypothetical protein
MLRVQDCGLLTRQTVCVRNASTLAEADAAAVKTNALFKY